MSEAPIIFSGPMVLALLAGKKTQTRRMASVESVTFKPGYVTPKAGYAPRRVADHLSYGRWKKGDTLWVRESCRAEELTTEQAAIEDAQPGQDGIRYAADNAWLSIANSRPASDAWGEVHQYRGKRGAQVPSIHMPRWASRITLTITDVRLEPLGDISDEDCVAEGISPHFTHTRAEFFALWDLINGARSSAKNPWVWALTFLVSEVRALELAGPL